ncbi:hypothetical protein [Actinocrispum wychmicini]|uniref:Uncharacterized protein n=1 Tax=Actinocrispum wychmicini TaxID=1213861 RepID=A0A4R2JF83_9PSEU|nr:hypothetical protein [Actinocrispum wychmicini]TCO56882.1 hypothetical protein EV192_106357 [Actinocrispum wychmicini]
MTFDPFAEHDAPDQPHDRPQDDTTTVTTTAVTAAGEHKVRVTLKAGAGYDAPWITIDGTDVHDAADQLGDTDGVKQLVELTVSAAKFLHRSYGPAQQRSSAGSSSGSGQRQAGKPAGANEAPNGEKRYCEHGQRLYKSGFSEKTGKNWGAFDCPEKVCDREWANNRK